MQNINYKETLKSYITGFALSVFFTIIAFSIVMQNLLEGNKQIAVLVSLGVLQAIVQLVFFLHLKPWAKNKNNLEEVQEANWNLAILIGTVGIILIVVVGALWIMSHLNHNMTPEYMNSRMLKMENIKKH
jgi:cytochrome o ubiquinol oxidase operon protein cyoD